MSRHRFEAVAREMLEPLVSSGVFVRVPLFANTLPFGYHYRLAATADQSRPIERRVRLVKWGCTAILEAIRNNPEEVPLLFYCTLHDKRAVESALAIERPDLAVLRYEALTQYTPRWLFVRRSMWFDSELKRRGDGLYGFNRENAAVLMSNVTSCEVHSDTPEQAQALSSYVYRVIQELPNVVDPDDDDALQSPARPHRSLQLYYFSAPSAMSMHRNRKFVPLEMEITGDMQSDEIHSAFETGMAIIVPKDGALSERQWDTLSSVVKEYHTDLYTRANAADGERRANSFIDLTWLYNRLAASAHRGDTFESEDEYARCLGLHHKAPRETSVSA